MSDNYSFDKELQQAEKEFNIGSGGDVFKFKEGDNKLRVLSAFAPIATHRISQKEYHTCYGMDEGCPYHEETSPKPSVKFLMWIIDRTDGKVKLAFMPYTIIKALRDLQNNPEYQFDALPMPYDLTVKATKAGTKEVEYSVVPARSNSALTVEEQLAYDGQKKVEEVIERMIAKEKNPSVDPQE